MFVFHVVYMRDASILTLRAIINPDRCFFIRLTRRQTVEEFCETHRSTTSIVL